MIHAGPHPSRSTRAGRGWEHSPYRSSTSIRTRKDRTVGKAYCSAAGRATGLSCLCKIFDRVFASLMPHRLMREDKRRLLVEVSRMLEPGWGLHAVDFEKPRDWIRWLISPARWVENIHGNIRGLLPVFARRRRADRIAVRYHLHWACKPGQRRRIALCHRHKEDLVYIF